MAYKAKGFVTHLEPEKHYTKEEIEATGHSFDRLQQLGALESVSGKEEEQEDPRSPKLATGAPPPLAEQEEAQPRPVRGRPPKTGDAAADANPPSEDDRPGSVRKAK